MPRKTLSDGPVVVVNVDGRLASWCDGKLAGDPDMVAAARVAAERGDTVTVWLTEATCDLSTPVGAAAALTAFRPGRAELVEPVPPVVLDWFRDHRAHCADEPDRDA